MSALTIAADPNTAPGGPIVVTVSTDAPMTQTVTVTGSAELPNGTTLTDTTTTTITGKYAASAPGYDAVEDPGVPGRFTLTPSAT